jgi:Tfp pilus assembly protein PilF
MATKQMFVTPMLFAALTIGGCLSSQAGKLLPAPSGTEPEAARHNQEGIEAYNNSQWTSARKHFEAAVKASPGLAEAHYNLGMVLYRTGAEGEARPHFVKAANLAPDNEVIWSSPAYVATPAKSMSGGSSSDGHGHSH